MRRALAVLVVLVLTAALGASSLAAQQPPSQPGNPNGPVQQALPCYEDCGGGGVDDILPTLELWSPSTVTVEYPLIEIQFCDNVSLNAGTRYITVNGVNRTSTFNYFTPGFSECAVGEEKHSSTTSVALQMGPNTLYASICDNAGNCASRSWTITRTGPGAPVVTLRNHNADNRDRGLCLTVGAGQAAGLSCGDLFVTHGLPAYRTMGRDRSLTLFYNSAAAAPRAVVAAAVTEPTGIQAPTSVYAELKINGVVRASATYNAIAVGATAQIAVGYDASGDAAGVYPFVLEVRNVYSGASHSSFVNGEVLVANRSASEFGAGWWLAGVEQLVLGQSGSRILWLGGDGSSAVYGPAGTNRWARAAGGYRDTLVLAGGEYTRYLRHGVRVVFDGQGRHIRTINRAGQQTNFTWGAPPGYPSLTRLLSVTVPPTGASGTTYSLAYTGSAQFLNWIDDPAGRRLDASVSTFLYGSKYTVASITDPDGQGVTFGYDGVGRMTSRQSRRSFTTRYTYLNGLHVTRIARPLAPGQAPPADSARDTLQWWDERGLAVGSPGGTFTAVDTAQAYTLVNGPRTDVVDVAKFWVDRWGAPTRIQDPVGAVTTIVRGDPAMPALPTRMVSPVGQVWGMAYDARGNLLWQADSTHEGHGTGGFQVAKTRYTYHDAVNPWAPDSVIDPEGVVTRIQYDTLGPSVATGPNGHQTQFRYIRTGVLRGLVDSIVELQVPTYTDTTGWGTTAPPANQRTRFYYNTLGNADSSRSPMNAVSRYGYNAYTQVVRQVGPTGDTTRFFPRLMGVVDSVVQVDPAGPDRLYASSFDAEFNRLSLVDRRNVTRLWHFDAAGRDTAEVDDYGVRERRFYGPGGLLDSLRTRAGANIVVRRTYDAAGRLTQIRYPARMAGDTARGDTTTFTYDLAGRMLTAINRSARTYRSYYREGTIRQDSQALLFSTLQGTHQYRYDLGDRRTRNVSFTGASDVMQVDYQYALDQLQRIIIDYPGASPATDTATYTWDALGRRQQLVTPHSATARWFYDADGRVRRVYATHTCVNGPAYCPPAYDSARADRRYVAYDRTGRPTIMSERVGDHPTVDSSSFTYDAFGQMRSRWNNGRRRDYSFDLSGNITNEFYTVGSSSSGRSYYIAPSHNRLLSDTVWSQQGGVGIPRLRYLYTNAGERYLDSAIYDAKLIRRMWYDALGRMSSSLSVAVSQGTVVDAGDAGADTLFYTAISPIWYVDDCRYDALGRRVRACMGNNMLFDGDNPDFIGGFWPARIVYGPGTNDPLVVYYKDGGNWPYLHYFITDGGGRLVSYTDSTGLDARVGYGQIYNNYSVHAGAVNNAESFGGSGSEVAGQPDISFFRNRYYDQRTGRWLTEDPIGVAGGANLYQYVGNNPSTFTDPFGLQGIPWGKILSRVFGRILGNRRSRAVLEQAASTAVEGAGEAISDAATDAPPEPPGGIPAAVPIAVGIAVGVITENPVIGVAAGVAIKLATEATPTGEGQVQKSRPAGMLGDHVVRPDATAIPGQAPVDPCAALLTPVLRCK